MTKKEKAQLHQDKCIVEGTDFQSGRGLETRFVVMMSLTGGELIALKRCLNEAPRGGGDSVGNHQKDDVEAFFRNALERAEIR